MSTKFYPLTIGPGVMSMPTKQVRSTAWAEVNNVRWREGALQPVGGQQQYAFSFASRCKAIHTWYDLNEVLYIAYLCETNLYVDVDGALFEITPAGGITGPSFTIVGYGGGDYGADIYGGVHSVDTSALLDKIPDAYSLDNFGSVLLAMASTDGKLLQWDPSLGLPGPSNKATEVVADSGRGVVPFGRNFVVTPERFVLIFGANDLTNGGGFRRFAWCDQENYKAWDYSNVTSQAGFLDIEPASPIITAMSTRSGTLFWTGKKTYISQFLGSPYIYTMYVELAATVLHAVVTAIDGLARSRWRSGSSEQGLVLRSDGTSVPPHRVRGAKPIDSDDVDDANVREQSCAVHVAPFNEFWRFFRRMVNSATLRVAIYNHKEGWWSQVGRMARSAGGDRLVQRPHHHGSNTP